jgi:hypothetical protein
MKFTQAPRFITDQEGNRQQVILCMDDFYSLLAWADSNKAALPEAVTPVSVPNHAVADSPSTEVATSAPELQPQLAMEGVLATGVRKSHEEVFSKAFEQVKAGKN